MSLIAFDWETTGTDVSSCRGVQFAALERTLKGVSKMYSTLCNPEISISRDAEKIHGISSQQLVGQPTDKEIASKFCGEIRGTKIILTGHNILPFDIPITNRISAIEGGDSLDGHPVIDTYQLAIRVWPEAPSHRLSVDEPLLKGLTQWLGLDSDMQAHDATNDCFMVLNLLDKAKHDLNYGPISENILSGLRSLEDDDIADWLLMPKIMEYCHFGMHRGTPWKDVPWHYAKWVANNWDWANVDIVATIKHHFNLDFVKMRKK